MVMVFAIILMIVLANMMNVEYVMVKDNLAVGMEHMFAI
jgi:hypothetical protein